MLLREWKIVKSLAQADRTTMLYAAGLALASMIAPVLMKAWLPKPARSLSLFVSAVSSAVLVGVVYQSSSQERREQNDAYYTLQKELYKNELKHAFAQTKTKSDILATQSLVAYIQALPPVQRAEEGKKYGVISYLSFPELQPVEAETTATLPASAASPGMVQVYEHTPPPEPQASEEWIHDLVADFCNPDQSRRKIHHFIINGPSQSGKSTLTSKLLELIAKNVTSQGQQCSLLLIDPKYPMTNWPIPASFKGFDQVVNGVKTIQYEYQSRRGLCVKAKESGQEVPKLPRMVAIIDEQDGIYDTGKGDPDLGETKDDRKEAAGFVLSVERKVLKEAAAFNLGLFIIGQSPLSGATGLSRSDMQQAVRIVLGNEALKWLVDKEFPYKEDAPALAAELKYWMDKGERVALICLNMGRPYVRAIPRLTIGKIVQQNDLPEVPQTPLEDTPQDNLPARSPEVSQIKPNDAIAAMAEWVKNLDKELKDVTDVEIIIKFEELVGTVLNAESGVPYVRERIQEKLNGAEAQTG